jgi:16S rRNA (uracil1498-N3)-methyltransferase
LNKVAREATKQCLRSIAPNIEYFPTLESALDSANDYQNKLFACEFATQSESNLSTLSGSVAMVVGSEGGFSRQEAEMAKQKGFAHISLGKRILRAETAAVALTAVTMFALGELQ